MVGTGNDPSNRIGFVLLCTLDLRLITLKLKITKAVFMCNNNNTGEKLCFNTNRNFTYAYNVKKNYNYKV